MKLGKIIQQSTALMIPWSVLMVLRYVNLQDFIFSQTLKTTFQNQLWFIPGWWTHFYRKAINGLKTKSFEFIGFSIDIQTSLKEVVFLDVTLNLQNCTYRPYKKPNAKPLYIHSSPNHSLLITKHLPNLISESPSKNSSNHEIFNTAKVEYENELKTSGYNVDLKSKNAKAKQNMV